MSDSKHLSPIAAQLLEHAPGRGIFLMPQRPGLHVEVTDVSANPAQPVAIFGNGRGGIAVDARIGRIYRVDVTSAQSSGGWYFHVEQDEGNLSVSSSYDHFVK